MEDSKNKKTKDDLTYRYFVAFSHSCGFGNIFLTLTEPMDTSETINQVHDYIENNNNVSDVVILNWKRIRKGDNYGR